MDKLKEYSKGLIASATALAVGAQTVGRELLEQVEVTASEVGVAATAFAGAVLVILKRNAEKVVFFNDVE